MSVNYNISMGNTKKVKHEIILAFLLALYMDILIFNVYRTVRHSTKTNKQLLHELKNQHDFGICVIFRFDFRLKTASYSFRKD